MEIKLGDTLTLKKKHPCGGFKWQVTRTGADIGIKCLTCEHRVMINRSNLEKRIKGIAPKE